MSRLLSSGNGSSGNGSRPVLVDSRALPASFLTHAAQDPASAWPGAPPNFAEQVVPHIITVSGRVGTRAYGFADEALRDSRINADKMRTDAGVMESVEARQRAVSLLNWHIEAEDATSIEQRQLVDEMTRIVRRTPDLTKLRWAAADCHWYGRAGVAMQYHKDWVGGHLRTIVKRWEPRNGDKFVFRWDDGSNEYDPDQVGIRISGGYHDLDHHIAKDFTGQQRNKIEGTQFGLTYWFDEWERKLLILDKHIIEDGPFDDPVRAGAIHGVGIRDRIYWTWYGMIECLADVLSYLERSAFGVEIWKYPAGNDQARKRCEDAAKRVTSGGRTVLIVPSERGEGAENFGVEHIEPGLGGIDAAMTVIKDYFGHKIKRYILGQTLTSEAAGTGLGSGVADAHMATFADIVKFDAVGREETLTRDFLRHLQLWNFPKSRGIYLRFVIDTESPDADRKMQGYQAAWNMGAGLKEEEVLSIIGASMPKDTDRVLRNPALQQQPMQIPGQGIEGAGQPGAMPGQEATGQDAQPGSLQDMFGPLASEAQGGQQLGAEPSANPSEGGGPAQYAAGDDVADVERYTELGQPLHQYSSTQFNLPGDLAFAVRELGQQIPLDDLTDKGREDEPHVTVKFGLHTNDAEEVRKVVQDCGPIAIQLGPASHFSGKEYDVVKIDVHSEQLHYLNRHICENLTCTDTHPEYRPHITIAYVKRGLGETYALKLNALKGRVAAFDRLIFSDKSHRHISIPLVGPAKYARKRQVRSSPGQQPLPAMGDTNTKQHHLWREELHPRGHAGQWVEKPGGSALPHQFGQGMLFHEMASRLHHAEQSSDPQVKASQQSLFQQLASADVPPEQLAALLSGDQERLEALRNHAHATGQAEMPNHIADVNDMVDPGRNIAPAQPPSDAAAGGLNPPAGADARSPESGGGSNETPSSESSSPRPAHVAPVPAEPVSTSEKVGNARQSDSEGGFELQQQKAKLGRGVGTEDKSPEISKGRQEAFFHGLNDAPGQEELFEGLDLAGKGGSETKPPSSETAEAKPETTDKPAVPAAALPPEPKKKATETSKEKRLRSLTGGHKTEGKPSLDPALKPEQRIARQKVAMKYLTSDGTHNPSALNEIVAAAYATNSKLEGALADVQKKVSDWRRKLVRAAIEADLGFLYRKHG